MNSKPSVAIVDDESHMRDSISQWLELSGYNTQSYASAEAALSDIGSSFRGVILSDIRMPGMDGMELLSRVKSIDPNLPVVLITGHGDVQMAVEAMRRGAYDFIEKPFNPEKLAEICRHAAEVRSLFLDNRALRKELADGSVLMRRLMGTSEQAKALRESVLDISQADGNVLITGETGSGKSLAARALHACGPNGGKPFVTLNCSAYSETDLNEALFGDPANPSLKPAIREAQSGTLCLEDIDALPDSAQARLLSQLEMIEEQGNPATGFRTISVGSGSATEAMIREALRDDLYYRLSNVSLAISPLRERGEDVLHMYERFSQLLAEEYGCEVPPLSAADAAALLRASWPGNIRQLENFAEAAVLHHRNGAASLEELLADRGLAPTDVPVAGTRPLKQHVDAFEKMIIENALRRHRGSISKVIDELAVPRRTLNEKMAKYELTRSDYV